LTGAAANGNDLFDFHGDYYSIPLRFCNCHGPAGMVPDEGI